jgi:hypothetical protein
MSKQKNLDQKTLEVAAAGTTSGLVTAIGIGLMFTGPIGMFAGGIILGAGISGGMNTIQQGCSEEE